MNQGTSPGDVTLLLEQARLGNRDAVDRLIPLVYNQLRRIARGYFQREREDHTLQPTALVNDALMQLLDVRTLQWQSRAHFFGLASRAMRRILIDHARRHRTEKRGGDLRKISLEKDLAYEWRQADALLTLDEALDKLKNHDSRLAQVVEMRFFGGMTEQEIAEVLNVTARTIKRDWSFARTWLYAEMTRREPRR